MESLESTGDKETRANLYFAIGKNYEKSDSLDKALIYWDRAYNDFEDIRKVFPQVLLLTNKIRYLRNRGDIESAKQLELKTINLISETEDLRLKGLLFFLIGNHYLFDQGRYNLALEYYLKSDEALEGIVGGTLYVQLINLLGVACSWEGNDEKAVVYFEKVVKYYQDLKQTTKKISTSPELNMVWVFTNYAGSLISLNRFNEADQCLESARQLVEKFNQPIPFVQYYKLRAILANKQGRFNEGLSYDFLAINVLKNTGNSHFNSEVTLSILQILPTKRRF